ncbi:Na(+)-translocating NADH-quinone reductase subunit A [Larkinella punicea]|uniref:Na(+)-translocating NADH-quinone reductase subunit A n=1 Tax=Larkinella punicea TaxID=2315727 RepID=A0A368JX48_9BACT|nr:Na(+)-translocating NADH-quinone reductase subunit A [Larkinella punicea]RCR70781.1 Na(+)-translocating NADH-quinone reductase subunit A [Larkinella punicea]
MGKAITLRKGFDIKLEGVAARSLADAPATDLVAVKPPDFPDLIPKLLVAPGDELRAGQSLFFDKNQPDLRFASPVSGEVVEVVRGEKRKILEIRILPDKTGNRYVDYPIADPARLSREAIIERLLESGCWPYIRQRPFSLIASPSETPGGIFVSCFDTAPLAPDLGYLIGLEPENFKTGLLVLNQLSNNHLHIGLGRTLPDGLTVADLEALGSVHVFEGPHPAGNVGVQIHHIRPIQKGDVVWFVHPQDVVIIGRLFREGRYRADRVVALTGSCVDAPQYYRVSAGQSVRSLTDGRMKGPAVRIIQGNVLTGKTTSAPDFLSFYTNQLTVIPEGKEPEFLGWLLPGLEKLSVSRTFLSWLAPKRSYALNTNTHGEERAFVMTGQYDRVLPMNILPVYLLKAILAKDLERMEQLGIYEVAEEDFALCEFVCTSKIEVQRIIAEGLAYARREG